MGKLLKKENMAVLAPIPALFIGAVVMHHNAISPFVYGQNIISYLVLALLLLFFGPKQTFWMRGSRLSVALLALGCLAVACTFLDPGMENVHRWLAIGGFRLYISSLVMPCAVIELGMLLQKKSVALPITIAMLIALLLILQPDASQLSAFAVSAAFLVWVQVKRPFLKYGVILLFAGAIIYSWIHIDALAPVKHVEGILQMALDMGPLWLLGGIVSLVLLLLPFLGFPKVSMLSKAVGVYYLVILASTYFGNFPVPFIGFGISPIIGYQLAMFFLFNRSTADTVVTPEIKIGE